MFSLTKRIIRRLFRKEGVYNGYKTYQEYRVAYSNEMADRIRAGGGVVGENVDFYDVKIDNNSLFEIGNNVTITNCRLLTHDACLSKITGCVRMAPIRIGDNVFVGTDAIILPGTKIGNNCIIGSGAVVAHDIPDNSVVIGNPCKVVCSFDTFVAREYEIITKNNPEKSSYTMNDFSLNYNKYKHVVVNNDVYQKFICNNSLA